MVDVFQMIEQAGILPVINVPNPDCAQPLANALAEGGLNLIEVTMRNPTALDSIRAIRTGCPNMLVGAGTVLDASQADAAVEAGAQFLVSPGLDEEVVRRAQELNVPVMPGCVTPSEVRTAMRYGLKALKFFPAEQMGGLKTIKDICGPYPDARFVPTCGMSMDNIGSYLANEKILAVGGSFMAPAAMVQAGDWAGITKLCRQAVKISLGFSLAHVGVNAPDADTGFGWATELAGLIDEPVKDGGRSAFAGSWVEFAKVPFPGQAGHIAFSTYSIVRARAFLEKRGVRFREDFVHLGKNGRPDAIYFEQEFGGLSVHLIEKHA